MKSKLWAVVPVAGTGSRFSHQHLKQYMQINGQTVLHHSLTALLHLPLAGYVLAKSAQDNYLTTLTLPQQHLAHVCIGGAERVDSVLSALYYLREHLANDEDWVLVHDAARPCVQAEQLLTLYQTACHTGKSAILAVPVRDTLKKATLNQQIERTVSREQMWQAQTPQLAKLATLINAIETALKNGITITDEASALEHCSEPVHLVAGRADNLKITYPEDLELARLILTAQQNFNPDVL